MYLHVFLSVTSLINILFYAQGKHVKLYMTKHHAMKVYWESTLLTLTLGKTKVSASHSGHFIAVDTRLDRL
jgi:hypothetical protein